MDTFNLTFRLKVIRHFDGCKADLVVCDGAPDGEHNKSSVVFSQPYIFSHYLKKLSPYLCSDRTS